MTHFRRTIKNRLYRHAPGIADRLVAYRQRRHSEVFQRRIGIPQALAEYLSRNGLIIGRGPFRGMVYIQKCACSALIPKLLGSYEMELHPWIERIRARTFVQVVDIGCAEGYYAVGFARVFPSAENVAYDIDRFARNACAELSVVNGVRDRIQIKGKCTHDDLSQTLRDGALVVCDCEGYEAELLNPEKVKPLSSAWMLVEVHERITPGVTQILKDRFGNSHSIEFTTSVERDPARFPELEGMSYTHRQLAVSEFRPGTELWALLIPLTA